MTDEQLRVAVVGAGIMGADHIDRLATRTKGAVVGAIVQLGQTLHLKVVAEGIETAAELQALRALGVDYGQGYHLGHPAEASRTSAGLGLTALDRRQPTSSGATLRA